MMKRMSLFFVLALLLSLGAAGSGLAQVTTASVTGRIADQQGASVPNATVTATNKATGLSRSTTTDTAGQYTISELPPGNYEISVEAQSFSKALVKDLELNVGSRQNINVELKPGSVNEVVNVSSDSTLIETTRSDLDRAITPREIQNLPLINRTFANLAVIAPEARPVGNFDPTKTRVGNVAFSGGDGRQVDVNVDGGDNKDNVVGSLLQNFSYESIQEFQVQQHRWTAESGRAVGGVVNVISKSGSNDLHGSFFLNHRNESLRATDFFEKRRQALTPSFQKPDFSRYEFGGSLGGKIIENKLFFFGAAERFRERQVNALSAAAVVQLPLIPGISAVGDIPTPYNDTLLTAKIDHTISGKQTMAYRFSYQKNDSPNDQIGTPANADLTGGNTNDNKFYSFLVNHTYTFSPTKLNQFSFHYQDFTNEILGVTNNPNLVFPSVQTGQNANVPQATLITKYQFRDDFSWTANKHTMKFGVNYIHTKLDGFFFFGARGYQITFFADPSVIRNNTNGLYPQGFATPGAVRQITFSDGRGDHKQNLDQLAFYFQDDYKVSRRLTLNLGLRWDANIGNLVDQTRNRTILLLKRLNHPRAQAIAGDDSKLTRTTPNYKEFQPRFGFAFDPRGDGRTVIRGGYGIFFDQVFQNLTLFSLTQSNPELYQTALSLVNSAVGVGQLSTFRFGVDPLPTVPPGFSFADLAFGGFGRINDPDASEPYVQKFSLGFETRIGNNTTVSSDFVHSLGLHEPRVQVINPQIRSICDPNFPGSTPTSPLCVRGASSRLFDQAFVAAGFPITGGRARIEQINMIGTTNRSLFDSWTTTLKHRTARMQFNASYVLSSSRAWGGQPVASYSGNGIAITPEQQFRPEEFGSTRIDERHRVVISGVFEAPWGIQLAPILQYASARPYSLNAGLDIDGDGLATNDRICAGIDPRVAFDNRGGVIPGLTPGCTQVRINSVRDGFITDPTVTTGRPPVIDTANGRYFNVDLRAQKTIRLGEKVRLKGYVEFYNLFNADNLSLATRLGISSAASIANFRQPVSLFGPGFGPPVGRPFTASFGFRLDF
jgi:hypothetical protein